MEGGYVCLGEGGHSMQERGARKRKWGVTGREGGSPFNQHYLIRGNAVWHLVCEANWAGGLRGGWMCVWGGLTAWPPMLACAWKLSAMSPPE